MNKQAAQAQPSIFKSKEGRKRILERYNQLLSEVDFAYTERYVETSFGSTYLLESGSSENPPLFLFHGSTSNSAAWFGDIKQLTKHFRVIAVDLIGDAGHSAQTRPDMKTDEYARWIRELFEQIGVEKASLMGNSLGAWTALQFATTFPEKVEKMVLLAASGIAPIRPLFVLRLIIFSLRGEKGAEKIMQMVYGNDPIPREVKDYLALISENYSPYTGVIPVLKDEEMKKLSMPILYIAGEDDQLTNAPKCEVRLRKLLAHSEIIILKNTGHVIYNVLDRTIPFLLRLAMK